jgi:aminoglycoside phosphotransferase (APT) family kinase protein
VTLIDVFAIIEDLGRRRGVDADRISVIELNRSGESQVAVALLAFLEGGPDPIAFIKATPDAERAAALGREFENLTRLACGGGEAFRRSVPEPLYFERVGDLTVLAETAAAGTRMKDFSPDRYFASRRFRDHFSLAVRWLVDFHGALPGEAAPPPAHEATREIDRYRGTHRVSPALDELLQETAEGLQGVDLLLAPSHGDFCTANILIPDSDGIVVIDWEYPLGRTWPLSDLLYFISSTWCVPYRKGRAALRANYRQLFFARHGFSELLGKSVSWYVDQLKIATELTIPLSVMAWAAFANRKHDELARARAAGTARDETVHIPLVMIEDGACLNLELLAEHRDSFLPTRR